MASEYTAPTYPLGHVCEHETLARKCDICDLKHELKWTQERVSTLETERAALIAEVKAWRDWIAKCGVIPLSDCTCEDVPRGQNLLKAIESTGEIESLRGELQ
jgi:hypothetical protein